MNTPPTNREQEIFAAAAALPEAERAAYLDAVCGDDHELCERVGRLLASHEASGFMEELPETLRSEIEEQFARLKPEEAGERIGNYKLLEQIGEGGFGTVWVADQEQPVRRRVALKLIKLGMDTKDVIARFEQERQALALMDHPNIARVLDAGMTQFGRQFFVMELVRGVKITDYCDQNNLPTTQRLDLFVQVCQAVQHAHQKGIIHRDIKPSNILVTLHDGVPVPKVIDFGIAKATQARLTDKTVYTHFEQMIGTPLYMSPEQAEMSGLDVDTRSDIYSLGVLLYELLVGRTPFDPETLMRAGLDEMRRVIREQEPQKPSTALQTMAADVRTSVAQHRQADGAKMAGLLRGDLDWIVMKALEKDRTRRYETANGFAQDIRRHIANEPVTARPPGTAYVLGKLIRRHKAAFAAVSAVGLALVLGIAGTTWGLMKAAASAKAAKESAAMERTAKEAAKTEAAISKTVNDFIYDMFSSASPTQEPDRDLKVRTVLDRAAARMGVRFQDQPLVEASILLTLAATYNSLGEFENARQFAERSVGLRLAILGQEHRETIKAMSTLAVSHADLGRRDEALKLREKVLALSRKVNGIEDADTIDAMNGLALSYNDAGRPDEALKLYEEVLALSEKVLGSANTDTLTAMHNLANSYHDAGRRDEALTMREEVLTSRRRLLTPEHPDTLMAMNNLALSYFDAGRREAALELREEVLAVRRRVLSPTHRDTLRAMNNVAVSYLDAGRWDEAIDLNESVLDLSRKGLGTEHPDTLRAMTNLSVSYAEAGRLREAVELQEQSLALKRRVLPPNHRHLAFALRHMAQLYEQTGRKDEAGALRKELAGMGGSADSSPSPARTGSTVRGIEELQSALELARKDRPEHADTIAVMLELATAHGAQGSTHRAIKLANEALTLARRVLPTGDQQTITAMKLLVRLYKSLDLDEDVRGLEVEMRALLPRPNDRIKMSAPK